MKKIDIKLRNDYLCAGQLVYRSMLEKINMIPVLIFSANNTPSNNCSSSGVAAWILEYEVDFKPLFSAEGFLVKNQIRKNIQAGKILFNSTPEYFYVRIKNFIKCQGCHISLTSRNKTKALESG